MTEAVTTRVSSELTRAKIIAATREVFAKKGSRGTTTREVAEVAGVNEATLFRHFGTKQQLIHSMLESSCAAMSKIVDVDQGPIRDQLVQIGRFIVDAFIAREDLMRVSMAEEVADPDGAAVTWRGPVETRRRLGEFMAAAVNRGDLVGDPEDLARIFLSLFFAYVMGRKIWRPEFQQNQRMIENFVDFFLNGARPR